MNAFVAVVSVVFILLQGLAWFMGDSRLVMNISYACGPWILFTLTLIVDEMKKKK